VSDSEIPPTDPDPRVQKSGSQSRPASSGGVSTLKELDG